MCVYMNACHIYEHMSGRIVYVISKNKLYYIEFQHEITDLFKQNLFFLNHGNVFMSNAMVNIINKLIGLYSNQTLHRFWN